MPNLKFLKYDWNDGLLFVEFNYGDKKLFWYPKWKDLTEILDAAWATEHGLNHKKWMGFLIFINLMLLTRYHLIDSAASHDAIINFNKVTEDITNEFVKRLQNG